MSLRSMMPALAQSLVLDWLVTWTVTVEAVPAAPGRYVALYWSVLPYASLPLPRIPNLSPTCANSPVVEVKVRYGACTGDTIDTVVGMLLRSTSSPHREDDVPVNVAVSNGADGTDGAVTSNVACTVFPLPTSGNHFCEVERTAHSAGPVRSRPTSSAGSSPSLV